MTYLNWRFSFGLAPYEFSFAFMQHRVQQIYEGNAQEMIWLLEHPSIYTAGVSARSEDLLDDRGLPVHYVNRGGKYTYHGPGQRIIYVMLNLKRQYGSKPDLSDYISRLEQWIINVLAVLNLKGERRAGRTGIWIIAEREHKEYKIAAIGVRVKKWITYHGIALNVKPILSHYAGIIPCGIREHGITSLHKLGVNVTLSEVDKILYREFYQLF
jgi:lipoyl(octanoyl) transferase